MVRFSKSKDFLHAIVVKVAPGGISGILSAGTQSNAEVKVRRVGFHSYGRAQHAALCFVVFPKPRRRRLLSMKRKWGKRDYHLAKK